MIGARSNKSTAAASSLSFVGFAGGTTTGTMPAHQAGDLIVAFGMRVANTFPAIPAGWTNIKTQATTTGVQAGARAVYIVAASGATAWPVWTTTDVCVVVLRNVNASPIGVSAGTSSHLTGAAPIRYPALAAFTQPDGSSWVLAFSGNIETDGDASVAPAGTTNRGTETGTGEIGAFDTNGGVASWAQVDAAVGGTSGGWLSIVIEILSGTPAASSYLLAEDGSYITTESGDRIILEP